jgi:hypothetical protein
MSTSDIIAIVGLLISGIGIPITFILARRTRQRPELKYAIDFDVILNPDDKLFDRGLYMTLGNRQIDSVSRTRVALWNQRGDTIHRSDLLERDPLRIQLDENDELLQVRVLSASREQIALAASINPDDLSSACIGFDFLDVGDGGVIEIVHKGPSEPKVFGTIQGTDITDTGHAGLGRDALTAVALKSRFSRFRTYAPKRTQITMAATVLMTALIWGAFLLVYVLVEGIQSPGLVSAAHYKLNTIPGQAAFASAVDHRDFSPLRYIYWVPLIIILSLAPLILRYIRISKRKIPRSIVIWSPPAANVEEQDKTPGQVTYA